MILHVYIAIILKMITLTQTSKCVHIAIHQLAL